MESVVVGGVNVGVAVAIDNILCNHVCCFCLFSGYIMVIIKVL
jgi:hypothetical protein